MSIEVKIPAVGESITSGVLSGWHKKTGDFVADGEALFTLETDKISTDVPASGSGRREIRVDAGQEVKIGQVVGLLDEKAAPAGQPSAPKAATGPEPAKESETPASSAAGIHPGVLPPSVRRIAEEEKVNLADVQGTGKHGQVTKSDLVQYLESKSAAPPARAEPAIPK